MDAFLDGVGLAVQVGSLDLTFRGLHQTIQVNTVLELGDVLFRLAGLQEESADDSKKAIAR